MKIERINKGNWGKVRAFFDVRTQEGLVVKGFTLVEGINGQFVGLPSKKNDQSGDYMPTVWADDALRAELLQLATRAYGQESVADSMPRMESSSNSETEAPAVESNLETPVVEPAKTEEFNEDDIPF